MGLTEKMKLVELLGPQPILNLLSMRYLQAHEVLFVGTRKTHDISRHLQNMMGNQVQIYQTEVHDPHDPFAVYNSVNKKIRKLGWTGKDIVFDISDGTKMEAFALTKLAREHDSLIIDVELIYGRYQLRSYKFQDENLMIKDDSHLPENLINIGDYLSAYLPGYDVGGAAKDAQGHVDIGGRFEETIYHTLAPHVDEILAGVRPAGVADQIEIDLIVRRGNRVGIVEAKTGVKKAGIDQLDTAGNAHYLGDHVLKFLVTGRYLPRAHKMLAIAEEIQVIELPGYQDNRRLPDQEERRLVDTVKQKLDGR